MARIAQGKVIIDSPKEGPPHDGIGYTDGPYVSLRDNEGAEFLINVDLVERMMGVIETVRKAN